MLNEDVEKLKEMLEKKQIVKVREKLLDLNETNIAECIENMDATNALLVFRMLPKNMAADVFSHLSSEVQSQFINAVTDIELAPLLDEIYLDDIVDLIEEMPANVVKRILKNTSDGNRQLINQFLKYPKDSAGSLMTIEYVNLKKTYTVAEALKYIKETASQKETIYTCYVTGEDRRLEGTVSLRDLVLSDEKTKVEDILNHDIVSVNTHDDQETVSSVFKKYDFFVLPVVDNENRLIGIITVDDIIDVMEKEATEDFQKMAAMQPSEKAYLDENVFVLAKQRIGWLLILMVSQTFTSNIIDNYTSLLASMTVLTTFIPLLMDTGGNAGSQSSTLIIRGLATGEISPKDWLLVLWKESRIAIIVGFILSSFITLKTIFISHKEAKIGICVGITLFVSVILAKLTGALLPIVAKILKLDPAIMAGPLITTIVDSVSLILFFSISTMILF
ncbi:MAG: magnesium transporter [Treponema sp.]